MSRRRAGDSLSRRLALPAPPFPGMFKDMDLTAELQRQFDTFWASDTAGAGGGGAADADGTPAVGLDVAVLTSSYWPTYPKTTMTLPPSLAPSLALFEKFYSSKYTANRRLQWQHNLCHCLVKAQFPSVRRVGRSSRW